MSRLGQKLDKHRVAQSSRRFVHVSGAQREQLSEFDVPNGRLPQRIHSLPPRVRGILLKNSTIGMDASGQNEKDCLPVNA